MPAQRKHTLQEIVDVANNSTSRQSAAASLNMSISNLYASLREAGEKGIKPTVTKRPAAAAPSHEDVVARVHTELKRGRRTIAQLAAVASLDAADAINIVAELVSQGVMITRDGEHFTVDRTPQAAYVQGEKEVVIRANKEGKFLFGVAGDKHVASKYHREDVTADLYARFEDAGVTAVFDTGNWIDGEARFNTHDLVTHGLDNQCRLLAELHPKIKGVTTYAVWGDDHEGWYAGREGIDVGQYNERIMRECGHEWTDLGFMESHVSLETYDGKRRVAMAVVHPGGGSSYAISYAIQKVVESYEGGEKPAVGFFGHLHKQNAMNIRNVWCLQTACCQDQTPFMRKKHLEAHVGGAIVEMEQDQDTGAIIGFAPKMIRYFNRGYGISGRWSRHGGIKRLSRTVNPGEIPSSSRGRPSV